MKTIFVSLSMLGVFRNIFFFPESVFFRLMDEARRRNFRVVVLMHRRDLWKYAEFFAPHLGTHCSVEGVLVPSDKNIVQKAFRFFYAYLIYTATTKILTTMGMRPEEPPAASRRFLAPFRVLIARSFGRSSFLKKRIIPALYERVFPRRPFKEVFEKYRPALVVAPNLYGLFDTELAREARRHKVRSLGFLANWDHVDKYFLPIKTDHLLLPSEQVKRAAVKYQGYAPEHITVVGYPYHDLFVRDEFKMPRADLLRAVGLPAGSRYLLYTSGSSYCPDEPEVIEEILSWIKKGAFGADMYLAIRPYVGGRGKDKAFDEKKFFAFKNDPRVVFFDAQVWNSLEQSIVYINLMRHAGVVMTVYSTAFLESAIMDRPLVAASFDGRQTRPLHRSIRRFEGFEHFQSMFSTGAVKRALDFDELKSALAAYLINPTLDTDKRAAVREELCYILDGQSSGRVVDAVLRALEYKHASAHINP